MKKLLLFAAIAATALSFSAQEVTASLSQDWVSTQVPDPAGENRAAVIKDGKFFVQNKADGQVQVWDMNGLTDEAYASGVGTNIAKDNAGNIIVRIGAFPNSFVCDEETEELAIIPANGGDIVKLALPEELVPTGRADFFTAEGDVMGEDGGHLYIYGGTFTGVLDMQIAEGEIDARHSEVILIDDQSHAAAASWAKVDPFVNAAGEVQYLYTAFNANPALLTLDDNGNLASRVLAIADRGATNGGVAFSLNGKNFLAHPKGTKFLDGFGIYDLDSEELTLVAEWAETAAAAANGFQSCWLYAEKEADNKAAIYQYYPGGHFAKFTFTYGEGGEEPVEKKIYIDKSSEGNFWAWDKTGEEWRNYFDPWPGKAINELETEEVNGVECYVFEFTGESDFGMLFNDGSAQTSDIVPEWGKVYKYNGGTTYEVSDTPEEPVEAEYYVVGDFNGWDKESTKVKLEPNDDGDLETSVDLAANDEFKIITPADDTPDGWRYLGGIDENQMGYYLLNDETLGFPTELVDGSNFRVEKGGNYTLLLRKMVPNGAAGIALADGEVLTLTVVQNSITAVEDINVNNIASVKYVNLAGQVSATPFDGVNIQVTTMKDGSKKALKVVK